MTYPEIFVTQTKKGPRFYRMAQTPGVFRTFPVSCDVAETSMAAGATIYRKKKGAHLFEFERIESSEAATA